MSGKASSSPWIVRVARGHWRLWLGIALGAVVFALLQDGWNFVTRLLIAWNIGSAFYLVATAVMMARSPAADIADHAAARDEGAVALTVLTVVAAFASLGAIFVELAAAREAHQGFMPYAVAISTVILSWTFTHTIFTLHYAYEFYGEGTRAKGLDFPGDKKPDYWDFVYFSFVVGTTFQVSDVAITNKGIRRLVSAHGVLSFFFNTTIIALAVSMAANAI